MDRFTGIHAVREALEAGAAFDRIFIAKGRQDTRVEEIVQLARQRSIPVRFPWCLYGYPHPDRSDPQVFAVYPAGGRYLHGEEERFRQHPRTVAYRFQRKAAGDADWRRHWIL